MATQKIVDIRQGLDSGIFLSKGFYQIPLWDGGANVMFYNGAARKWPGRSAIIQHTYSATNSGGVSGGVTVVGLWAQRDATTAIDPRIYYAVFEPSLVVHFYDDTGAKLSPSAGFSWSLADGLLWSFARFKESLLIAQRGMTPQILADPGTSTSLSDLGVTVSMTSTVETQGAIIGTLGPHALLYGLGTHDYGVYSRRFAWSGAGDATEWDSATSEAGWLEIYDARSPIRAAVPLGDAHLVYTEDGIFAVSYVGAPFYFGARLAIDSYGAWSKAAVIPVGRVHYVWGPKGFYVTDGVTAIKIDEALDYSIPKASDFQNEWGTPPLSITGYHDIQAQQVIWFIGTYGFAFNYESKSWTTLSRANQIFACLSTGEYTNPLTAYSTYANSKGVASIYEERHSLADVLSKSYTDTLETIQTSLTSKVIQLDPDVGFAYIDFIRVGMVAAGSVSTGGQLTLEVAILQDASETPSYGATMFVDKSFSPLYVRKRGRYMKLRFKSVNPMTNWRIEAIEVHGQDAGKGTDT